MTKVLLAVTVGALSAVMSAAPAHAHNSLVGSTPEKGARIARAPESITLRFLARVDPGALTVGVTGPGGIDAGAGRPDVEGTRVTVPWTPGPAGEYTVAYQVGSSDGHPVKGTVRFTLTGPVAGSSAGPSAGASVPPSAGPVTGALQPTAAADDGPGAWPWIAGAGVLVVAGLTGAAVVRRRRRAAS
jgi:hypothetical protein